MDYSNDQLKSLEKENAGLKVLNQKLESDNRCLKIIVLSFGITIYGWIIINLENNTKYSPLYIRAGWQIILFYLPASLLVYRWLKKL